MSNFPLWEKCSVHQGGLSLVGSGPRGSDSSELWAGTWLSLPLSVMWDACTSPMPPDLDLTQFLSPLAHWFIRWRHWCEHLHPDICCSGLGLCRVTYTMSQVRTCTKLFLLSGRALSCFVCCRLRSLCCALRALIINTHIKIHQRAPRVPQTFEHESDCPQAMHLANAHPSEVWARNNLQSYQRLLFAWLGRPSGGKTFPLTTLYSLYFDIISAALISSFAHTNTFPTSVSFNLQLVSLREKYWQKLVAFSSFPKLSWQIFIKKTTDYTGKKITLKKKDFN